VIVISSHRALKDSPEVAKNQIRAHKSWQNVFDEILYFGDPEPELTCPKTSFITSEDFPPIAAMATAASMGGDFACLINADIVVSKGLIWAMGDVWKRGGMAATSKRYEFVDENLNDAQIVDVGIDFFGASYDLWAQVAKRVPPHYRVGHSSWDTWLMGFFNTVAPQQYWDITNRRCIYHPKHGDRKRAHHIKAIDDIYTLSCGFPMLRL